MYNILYCTLSGEGSAHLSNTVLQHVIIQLARSKAPVTQSDCRCVRAHNIRSCPPPLIDHPPPTLPTAVTSPSTARQFGRSARVLTLLLLFFVPLLISTT